MKLAFKFQPCQKYELGHAHRSSCECKTLFLPNFIHLARAEIRHAIARKFQPGEWIELQPRSEIRHVIGPLEV